MTSPMDDFRNSGHDRFAARNANAFESRTLEFLLQTFKLQQDSWRIRRASQQETGRLRPLTLLAFCREYRSFPILLTSQRIEGIHLDKRAFLPALFEKFLDAPFVTPYEDYREGAVREADGRAIGMVFPRKGISRGLIVHDGVNLPDRCFAGTVLTYTDRKTATKKLFVQPFARLIESLQDWQPH